MSESTLENIPNKITLSVVLPTYNEQENIIMVISKLKQVLLHICQEVIRINEKK